MQHILVQAEMKGGDEIALDSTMPSTGRKDAKDTKRKKRKRTEITEQETPEEVSAPRDPQNQIPVSRAGFTAQAKARFPELTPVQWERLERLGALVQEWNCKVNVISRKDVENVLSHHVLPCMGISKLLSKAAEGTKVMDVGTGGGFPGLPLAICCPQVKFWLVDSIGKKVRVVGDMAVRLGLQNVRVRHTRVEEVRERFNFVTGRSVTAMPRFVGWVKDKLHAAPSAPSKGFPDDGILYIKGGVSDETQEEDLGGWMPTARYPIGELIGGDVYDGDKSVLHFSVQDLRRGPDASAKGRGGNVRR